MSESAEHQRLLESRDGRGAWKRWGPYLSDRQWGTVREDYSPHGTAWDYFPHDHARSRAYRWGEDGIAGLSDDEQRLCFAVALWNGQDPILKERFFGLTGNEGNHGEDVKECYFFLDATPTHSYLKMLYKYPQRAFPYTDLVETNRRRGRSEPEYELIDTGVFADDRYFDVVVEYAKAGPDDILIRISATNRGPDAAELHLLPTLWFRNTWSWGSDHDAPEPKPILRMGGDNGASLTAEHHALGTYVLACQGEPRLLFTENETNAVRLFGAPNKDPYVKDGIEGAVLRERLDSVNPDQVGTKSAAHYRVSIPSGETVSVRLRLTRTGSPASTAGGNGLGVLAADRNGAVAGYSGHLLPGGEPAESRRLAGDPWLEFDGTFALRIEEAASFYESIQPARLTDDERLVQRQAFAGLIWSKQYYYFEVEQWLRGDPSQPEPPEERSGVRNAEWRHFSAGEIMSMPDTWEYPWFAAWDLAFHCIPFALIDPDFAKEQLVLLGREWFLHPNGQVPAYEWAFGDVNPPVLAWAAWRVYKIEQKRNGGHGDLEFLERVFHKLLLNFTWWVNRKDSEGNNVFQGGFLGLDNIGVFDRSAPLPTGGHIEQSDGTSWMGMFCLNMLTISLELARTNRTYEDIASKFLEHFLYIAQALNDIAGEGIELWDDDDEFFYDVLHLGPNNNRRLKVRSLVGLIPLFAVTTIEPDVLAALPQFASRLEWFLAHRPNLARLVSRWHEPGMGDRRLLALCRGHRMKRILRRMLDEREFLSDYGVRAISRYHLNDPYIFQTDGAAYTVQYQPAESNSGLFGGNSNWRGPIWFPVNYLIVEALQQFHHYYGDDFRVEAPTGSGQILTLREIADNLIGQRLINIFVRDRRGRRAVLGEREYFQRDPHWRDLVPFHEYFNGDTGAGVGASHQTGWTALVAKLIDQVGRRRQLEVSRPPSEDLVVTAS